ncbi:Transcription factor MYB86 [Senna tora]|uniref:Transcription factor MYB86 n=1 Tax=Senna tora TaxID=362788 RepID=A0A834WMB0_9FABA|nr:Transcription factor MYB86 [Senna tora]
MDHHHSGQYNYIPNQLDLATLTNKPPLPLLQVQDTLFSSTCPLFMFDVTNSLDGPTTTLLDGNHNNNNNNARAAEMSFHHHQDHCGMGNLSNETTWNNLNHQVQAFAPPSSASANNNNFSMSSNYLPPLIENVAEQMVGNIHEVQSCSMEEEGEMGLELNEWVVDTQQHCANFIFWDNVEEGVGHLGGGEIPPCGANVNNNSPNMPTNTALSSFPSSL